MQLKINMGIYSISLTSYFFYKSILDIKDKKILQIKDITNGTIRITTKQNAQQLMKFLWLNPHE